MINGHDLEFIEDGHIYLVDGVITPSVTEIMKLKFGNMYAGVDRQTLEEAAEKGTAVHEAIERWCKYGEESPLRELRDFKFLKKKFNFEVIENEVPVILEEDGEIIAAGRLDLVLQEGEQWGGGDIKRTATLHKDYLTLQLNLYRIAYRQTYGIEWEFLRGLHLRDGRRRYLEIPIKEEETWDFIHEWRAKNER